MKQDKPTWNKLMTIPIDLDFYEQVRILARYKGLSISALVRTLLRNELERCNKNEISTTS